MGYFITKGYRQGDVEEVVAVEDAEYSGSYVEDSGEGFYYVACLGARVVGTESSDFKRMKIIALYELITFIITVGVT